MNNPVDQPKVSELLPCPCGNMASFNITPRKAADITDEPLGYVSCPVCDIRTGARQSEAIAIGDWNAHVSRLSQPQATTAGVKALEWERVGPNLSAETPFNAAYTIMCPYRGSAMPVSVFFGRLAIGTFRNADLNEGGEDYLDPAKAAAQSHFEATTRSALIGIPGAEKLGDPIVWELEAAQRSHYQHFEGDSSGLIDDTERAKANNRLWAAIEAVLSAYAAPTSERVQALELALRPFAEMAVRGIGVLDDAWVIRVPTTEPQPTLAMFRHARAALLHEGQG